MNDNNKSQFFGTKKAIIEWLDKYCIENNIINKDLSVDVKGDVDISHQNLELIPIKFRNVTGNFYCNNNKLLNLIGSPKSIVDGSFNCADNQLTSLIGAPKSVTGSFWCDNNPLTNLAGSPATVGGSFYCYNNQLISLLEFVNSKFKGVFYFNIDEKNFKQKELIQILKKYYNSSIKNYTLTCYQFHNIIKPFLEKKILQKSLNNSEINTKSKNIFI